MKGSKVKQQWDYVVDAIVKGEVVTVTFENEREALKFQKQQRDKGNETVLTRYRRELRRY